MNSTITTAPQSPGLEVSRDLGAALERLRVDSNAIPWPVRRDLAAKAAVGLGPDGAVAEPFKSLLILLSSDAKWEVRKQVVESIRSSFDFHLVQVLLRLRNDSHSYVQRAAKAALVQHDKLVRARTNKKRGIELAMALEEELNRDYGPGPATIARRIAEHLYAGTVGAAAHEIRTVLTGVKADAAWLTRQQDTASMDAAVFRRKVGRIASSVEFFERIVTDMSSYSVPIGRGRAVIAISDLVEEAESMVREHFRARFIRLDRVKLTVRHTAGLRANVSRSYIVLCIVNILKNAIEALPLENEVPVGNVTLTTAQDQGHVVIVIEDNGCGIIAEELPEVRQCNPGHTNKKHGTGFGLCSTRRYLDAHRGFLKIDSRENVGTTVALTIPINSGKEQP